MVVVDIVDFIPHTGKQLSHTVKSVDFIPPFQSKTAMLSLVSRQKISLSGLRPHALKQCCGTKHKGVYWPVLESKRQNSLSKARVHVFCCCFSSVFFSKITTKTSTTVFAFVVHTYCPRSQPPPLNGHGLRWVGSLDDDDGGWGMDDGMVNAGWIMDG